jgi:hypothetical protein
MRRVAASASADSSFVKRKSGLAAGLAANRKAITPPHATKAAAQTIYRSPATQSQPPQQHHNTNSSPMP